MLACRAITTSSSSKKLQGRDVQITHGLRSRWRSSRGEPPDFRDAVSTFVRRLVSHYVLDEGRLVVRKPA
jgi:protein phosphatase